MAMNSMSRLLTPPAQVVQSAVSDSQLAYHAGERSTPWWKAIDGPISEDHTCAMESFLDCEDMRRLERMCLLQVAVFEDQNEVRRSEPEDIQRLTRDMARTADVSEDSDEPPNFSHSRPVPVPPSLQMLGWHKAVSDYLKTRNRCREHLTNRKAIRMRGGKTIQMASAPSALAFDVWEMDEGDELASWPPTVEEDPHDRCVDDSERSESGSLVKRNVVISAAPHVRQRQQQQRRHASSSRRSSRGSIAVPETFKSPKASATGGRESSAQSTQSTRENKSAGNSLPSLVNPTSPLSGVRPAFRNSRRFMSSVVSQERLNHTGSKSQPTTPRNAGGSFPGAAKLDTRLQRTGASVATGT